jgi:anti-anti-sigma factor
MCRPFHAHLDQAWSRDLSELRPPRIELSEPGHSHPVLRCAGELDAAVAPELGAMLDAICGREIDGLLLDFADVELLDARVLALIESARLRLEGRGATLRVVAAGQPLRLLRLTGMAERITTLGCRARGERLRPRIGGSGDAAAAPRFEPWPALSSSSSSPTLTSGLPGVAATQ